MTRHSLSRPPGPPSPRSGGPPAPPLEIGPRELAAWRDRGVPHALLDVREPWEVAICGFDPAIHVPLGRLLLEGGAEAARLPRDRPLVVICHHGRRSLAAALHLRSLGIDNAVNLAGGIDAWATIVDPEMARY